MKRPLILMGLVSILIGLAFVSIVPLAASTPQTTIFVDPATVTVLLCGQFTVDINITDVVDLVGWQFRITFNPNLVECLSVEEGPFLKSLGGVTIFGERINNTAGYALAIDGMMIGGSVSGSGTLANVTFHCLGPGDTNLAFDGVETYLVDSKADRIPHNTVDGYVEQIPPTIFVDPATVTVPICEQFTVDINITDVVDLIGWQFRITFNPNLVECLSVEEGPFLKSAGITIFGERINNTAGYALAIDGMMIGGSVSGSGTLANVTFHCLGKGDTYLAFDGVDTYLVDSNLDRIPHNTVDGYVEQRWIPEDVNDDGIVDIRDIGICCKAFGSYPGDPRWKPQADLDKEYSPDLIDIYDLVSVAVHFGEKAP